MLNRFAARPVLAVLLCLAAAGAPAAAAVWSEDFASDPSARGWRVFGDSSLFQWSPAAQGLDVTWDSSRPNSFFHRPLGDILTRRDDFTLEFDLRLQSIEGGFRPEKASTFQIAVGLVRLAAVTNTSFVRATVPGTANVVEFDYFPPAGGIDATVSPVLVSSNHQFLPAFAFPLELSTGSWFRVVMRYAASNQTLVTTLQRDGQPFGLVPDIRVSASFTDFRVDTLAVCSYSDAGDPEGSVRARGVVDNLRVTTPPSPVRALAAVSGEAHCGVRFLGRTNWSYTLLRSPDLQSWSVAQQLPLAGATNVSLSDPLPLPAAGERRFYRVLAERP
jgi:hypothetical protein